MKVLGKQAGELLNGSIHKVLEGMDKPILGIDLMLFAASKKGIDDGGSLSGLVIACKEVVFTPQGDGADGIFCKVVIYW